jgi:hypothetical protein
MVRLRELEDENCRLKKMYCEERLKARSFRKRLQKSGQSISAAINGAACSSLWASQHQAGVPCLRG